MRSFLIFFSVCWAWNGFAQPSLSVLKKGNEGRYLFVLKRTPSEYLEDWRESKESTEWWRQYFQVRVEGARLALFGSYKVKDDKIIFQPRFPLDPAVKYVASFEDSQIVYQIQSLAKSSIVLGVFPNHEVPENLLRFYIHFSKPMGVSDPFDFISLKNGEGTEITDAFVEVPEGLWNSDRTRLTVLLHPGRIKQGVGPNVVQGKVIEEGRFYSLEIKEGWTDNHGKEIQSMKWSWGVTKAVRTKIDPEEWEIEREENSIRILTGRILDREMVNKKLALLSGKEEIVGYWQSKGTVLQFLPDEPFELNQKLELYIIPTLEDVSGNTLLNAFDIEGERTLQSNDPIVIEL